MVGEGRIKKVKVREWEGSERIRKETNDIKKRGNEGQ